MQNLPREQLLKAALTAGLAARTLAIAIAVAAIFASIRALAVEVTLRMKVDQAVGVELFFANHSAGYGEERKLFFEADAGGTFRDYSLLLSEPVLSLRVDPEPQVGAFRLASLTIATGSESIVLSGTALRQAIQVSNMVELLEDDPSSVHAQVTGHDPYLHVVLPKELVPSGLQPRATFFAAVKGLLAGLAYFASELLIKLLVMSNSLRRYARRVAVLVASDLERRPSFVRRSYRAAIYSLLASFVALGLCLTFGQPAFSAPDEATHWDTGHIRAERLLGDPDCVRTLAFGHSVRQGKDLVPYDQLRTMNPPCRDEGAMYGDIVTYPGLWVSKVILPHQQQSAIRLLQAVLATRLFQGLIVALALLRVGLLALRSERAGSLVLLGIAQSPLLAQQAFSISADGTQLAFGIALASVILFWEYLTWLDLVLLVLFGWGAGAKPFLIPCIFPSIVIGYWYSRIRAQQVGREIRQHAWRTLKMSGSRFEGVALWLSVGLTLFAAVLVIISRLKTRSTPVPIPGANFQAQLEFLFNEPLRTVRITFRDFLPAMFKPRKYAQQLGWLDTPVSRASATGFSRLLFFSIALDVIAFAVWSAAKSRRISWQSARRLAAPVLFRTLACLASVLTIVTLLYLIWTPVGHKHAWGVQIRYFLPTMFVFMACLWGAADALLVAPKRDAAATLQPEFPIALRYLPTAIWTAVALLAVPYLARLFIDLAIRYL